MSVTVDDHKRVVLPGVKPGEEFDVQASGEGVFILRRLEPVQDQDRPPKCKLVKNADGFTVIQTDRPLDLSALEAALKDFPP